MATSLRRSRRARAQTGSLAYADLVKKHKAEQEKKQKAIREEELKRTRTGKLQTQIEKLTLEPGDPRKVVANARKRIKTLRAKRRAREIAHISNAAKMGMSEDALKAAYGKAQWKVTNHPAFKKKPDDIDMLTAGLDALRPFAVGTQKSRKTEKKARRAPKQRKGGTRRSRR